MKRFLDAAIVLVSGALALWFGDLIVTLFGVASQNPSAIARGLGVALHAALLVALAGAALLGLLGQLLLGPPREPDAGALRRYLVEGSPEQHRARITQLFALALLSTLYLVATFLVGEEIAQRTTRFHFTALLFAAASAGLIVACAVFYPVAARLAERALAGWAKLPGLRRMLDRTLYVIGSAIFLATIAAGVIVGWLWTTFALLPWSILLRVLFAVAVATVVWLRVRTSKRTQPPKLASLVLTLALIASGVLAMSLTHEQWTVRRIAFEDALSGRIASAAIHAVADFDRDGALHFWGGGDCDPRDPKRHPGAFDEPGNGVDEDCSGADRKRAPKEPLGNWQEPVPESIPTRPDIVLVTIDAFSAKHLQTWGYDRAVTPNLDALAQRSAIFLHCFSQGPSTRLSFPAMWTSRWDSQLERVSGRRNPYSLAKHEHQLAELLQPYYETVAVLPYKYFERSRWPSVTRGFKQVDVSAVGAKPLDHNAAEVTDAAVKILNQAHDKPLFLWVHYYDAHFYHQVPPGAKSFGPREKDKYDAELAFIDQQLVRLFEAADKHDNRLLIVTSDHAEAFHPQPNTRREHNGYDLYTATLHVPLIFNAPYIDKRQLNGIVSTMDILPTLVNVLRIGGSHDFQGTSLIPELIHGAERGRVLFHQFYLYERELSWATKHRPPLSLVSMHTDRYNLLLDRNQQVYEMYDWRQDYYEMTNLLDTPAPPQAFPALRERLGDYVQAVYRFDETE